MASISPPPRRRFLPQPVDTTFRSSKRPHPTSPERLATESSATANTRQEPMATSTKPRRFLPQPVEESVRSSRKKKVDQEEATTTKQTTDSRESGMTDSTSSTNAKPTVRRFPPQPVETTTRTARRKFAPEPVETSTRSSKSKKLEDKGSSPVVRPRRKFAVEPVETTSSSRRRRPTDDSSNDSPEGSSSETSSKVSSRRSSGSRRFSPELIETAKGEFRHVKKDQDSHELSRRKPSSPGRSQHSSDSEVPESRFSAAALARRQHEEHRRHSYCVPNLPIIESDSSGEDSAPSACPSTSSSIPDHIGLEKIEEGESGSYLDYVYSLADRKRLQEQAMAAYINEVPYEPVSHFAAEDEDDEDHGVMSGKEGADPQTFRRSSQDELDLEMLNMRKHHEQLEQAKQDLAKDTAGASRFSAAALAARHHLHIGHPKIQAKDEKKKTKKNRPGDAEFASMRAAASPPMLGNDIVFPYTISPRMTRCDVDQAPRPRRADSDDEPKSASTNTQLWTASVTVQSNTSAGLWMGMCQRGPEDQSRPATPIKSGLQTPAVEVSNPFELWSGNRGSRTPGGWMPGPKPQSDRGWLSVCQAKPKPPVEDDFTSSIDKKLQIEKTIDEEFPNSVVTQIYNYLSLGYPSLARPFDEELSKISRISVEDLRKDDNIVGNIKGYVGAPEGEGQWEVDDDNALRGCRRWEALRLYIREWARQSPNFASERASRASADPNISALKLKRGEAWGATVRKGSWAL